jgi:hypothetical protein
VGWWTFDVGDGPVLKDVGPLGVDGIAYHDVCIPRAERVEGHRGRALKLTENGDFADITHYTQPVNSTNLEDMKPFIKKDSPMSGEEGSIFMWLKVEAGKGGCVLSKEYGYGYSVYGKSGTVMVELFGGGKIEGKDVKVADGQWHHVGLTFKNMAPNGTTLYIDGEPRGKALMKARGHQGKRMELSIPRGWGGSDSHLDGCLDDVMFFSRVLSDEEVKSLFKNGEVK